MYRLRSATKFFAQGSVMVRAVDGIDLDIDDGEFVVIEGPSGSGKSTLLQLLGALDRPTGGEVWFGESDLAQLGDRDLARLRLEAFGFVFQQFNLLPTLTALENVEAALAPLGWKRGKARERARRLLEGVGLGARVDHLPPQLSGGEQQRVAIARALTKGPKVILADEPTGNLDSRTGREIIALLRRLSRELNQTVIVITHDPDIAAVSPRVVQMRDGRIVGDGPGTGDVRAPATTVATSVPPAAVGPPPPAPVDPVATGHARHEWVPTSQLRADDRPEILRAEGVRKTYVTGETPVEVLTGLTLTVHQGEFVTVTGPSGSGKTTMLNCLSGLDRIDAGRVVVDGSVVHEIGDAERSRLRASTMGFIFQAWNLVPVFSAVENTELPLLLAGVPSGKARKQAAETLSRVGLGHRLHHRPGELSGGEQQRVAIARALANRPRLVWADEPTGNLDSETAATVMRLLRDMHRDGLTIVLVTHDESIADSGSRRIRMRDGVMLSDHSKLRRPGEPPARPPAVRANEPEPERVASDRARTDDTAAKGIAPGRTMTKAERRAEKRRLAESRKKARRAEPPVPTPPIQPTPPPMSTTTPGPPVVRNGQDRNPTDPAANETAFEDLVPEDVAYDDPFASP